MNGASRPSLVCSNLLLRPITFNRLPLLLDSWHDIDDAAVLEMLTGELANGRIAAGAETATRAPTSRKSVLTHYGFYRNFYAPSDVRFLELRILYFRATLLRPVASAQARNEQ